MRTVEITVDKKQQVKLLKALYKLLSGSFFHFFFEDENTIILRIHPQIQRKVTNYLKKRKIGYKTYAYPLGRGKYIEDKKGVVYKYQDLYKLLFATTTELALRREVKEDMRIIERVSHALINQLGYTWDKEVYINLELAYGRTRLIDKYSDYSWGYTLYNRFVGGIIRFALFTAKGL